MKKFLYVLTIALGTCFAANAQSSQTPSETIANDEVKVEVAGQSVQSDATIKDTPAETKACCSSKKGKETASAGKKGCCADGKKSSAHCSDKKAKADAGITHDHE